MPYEVPRDKGPTAFQGGKQLLASIHFQYTEEGGTLDAAAIGNRYVELGEPFVFNKTTGRYVPFTNAAHITTGALTTGFGDPVLLNVDFNCNGTDNVVVGELLIKASVYDMKLPAKVTNEFRAVTPNIRYVRRGL